MITHETKIRSEATGVAAIITNTDGSPITQPSNFCRLCQDIIRKNPKGSENCFRSDAEIGRFHPQSPIVQHCMSGGLWDAGAAISVGGRHLANWLIGQVRDESQTEDSMRAYAREIGADEEAVAEAVAEVTSMSRERFEHVAQFLFTLANQLSAMAYQNAQQTRIITERQQMEQALKESESRVNEAQKMAGLGYWEWDVKTGEVEWSEEVYRIFHLDPFEFTPQIDSIMKLSPWPEYNQRHEEIIQRFLETQEQGSYDQKFVCPDGSIGYYHSTFKGEFDKNGNLMSMQGTVMDITERKSRESEMRRLRNYLSNIIDSMPSILVTVDREGNVTQWNYQTVQATGRSFEEVHNQPLAQVFPRLADEMERIHTSIKERRIISSSKIPRKVEQETRFEDVTIYPLIANGAEGAVIRVDDVTEQVRLEEMMIQSEKMLSVGGLAAGMAHEINNPLAGMIQTANVMKSRLNKLDMPSNLSAAEDVGVSMDAIQAFMGKRGIFRMVETINESGRRMAAIVNNMLSFARKSDATASRHRLEPLLDKTVELAATDYD